MFNFISQYETLREVLLDQKLAALGDAYVNFIYSVVLSKRRGEPIGVKVENHLLAEALRRSGLRKLLPSRIDRHKQANAAEALIIYALAQGSMTIEEGIGILDGEEDTVEAFCHFLLLAKNRINL